MKKNTALITICIIFALFLTGCGLNELSKDPDITGIIYSTGEQEILVVEGIESAGIAYEDWSEEGFRAVYFRIDTDTIILDEEEQKISFNNLYIGQLVDVWITGPVAESYPEQAKAKIIKVHP